jgi:hypothetical protein
MDAAHSLRRYPLYRRARPGRGCRLVGSRGKSGGRNGRDALPHWHARTTKSGREIVLGSFNPGDLLGEYALLRDQGSVNMQSSASYLQAPRVSYPWVAQKDISDCGAASLAMIARFYDQTLRLSTLREALCVGQRGASLKECELRPFDLPLFLIAVVRFS